MGRRLTARVIGNAAYKGGSALKNPGNDADEVAAKLEGSGFSVVKMVDCSNADLGRALKRFNGQPRLTARTLRSTRCPTNPGG